MKKLLSFTISVFTLFLFTGCGSGMDNFKDEAEITNLSGLLEEKDASDDFNGSYKLTLEDDEIIPLRSLTIKLGSKQYLNNKVTVSGVMNENDEVFEVTGVMVNEVLSEDSYKGRFVSYKNYEFGFKLKYYDDWTIVEGASEVAFYSTGEEEALNRDHVKISQETFNYEVIESDDPEIEVPSPLESYFNQNYPEDQNFPEISNLNSNIHKVGIDKVDALKFEYADGKIEFTLYRPGFIYKLTYIPDDDDDDKQKTFNEMISEFQFLGSEIDAIDSPVLGDLKTTEDDELVQSKTTEVIDEETGEITYLDLPAGHEYTPFESSLYSFSALMPDDWYYAGSTGYGDDVLHHYAFSEGPVEDDLSNEVLGLDIISSEIPDGERIMVNGVEVIGKLVGDQYFVYRSVGGHKYRLYALNSKELYDVLVTIAASITPIEHDETQ